MLRTFSHCFTETSEDAVLVRLRVRAVQGGLAAHARDDQRDARLPLRGLQRRSPLRRGLKQPAPQVRVRHAGTNAAGEIKN